MKNRKRVYVQVRNKTNGHWSNYKAKNTYDEAVDEMKKLQESCDVLGDYFKSIKL